MPQQFTNFCCRAGGSNLNAGTVLGDDTEPATTALNTYTGGSWVQSTAVFTVASGNPVTDGVTVGQWASVYPNGATSAVFIGRITARSTTTITFSASPGDGNSYNIPVDASGTMNLRVGGAWLGPNGDDGWPLGTPNTNTYTSFLRDTTGRLPRINLKNDQTYSITSAVDGSNAGYNVSYTTFQGYQTSYGDFGLAIIDGGTTGASYSLFLGNHNCTQTWVKDFIFQNNGNSDPLEDYHTLCGAAGGSNHCIARCVARNSWSAGFAGQSLGIECEAYNCALQNDFSSTHGGWSGFARCTGINRRCIAHSMNRAFNAHGYHSDTFEDHCIAANISGAGFDGGISVSTDCYKAGNQTPGGHTGASMDHMVNCNSIAGLQYGFYLIDTSEAMTCRGGAGTAANALGVVNNVNVTDVSNYSPDKTPWADPDGGDFHTTLDEAKGTGRGFFLQTAAGYSGTVAAPDLGSVQHRSIGILVAAPMSGGM